MDKIINVTKSSLPPLEEYIEKIKPLWEKAWLTNMGELHFEFEKMLIDYLNVDNISLFVNGHLALELLLQAMNLTGEVITTPFSFASTTHAIIRNGLTPVFCDIDQDTFTLNPDKIEKLITKRTSAILPVHIYGNICDVKKIEAIARKYKLKVIYDAAHSFGTVYKGIGVGNFGDASMFSFHATKVFNSIEGGAVSYKEKSIGEELYKLKNFGIKSQLDVDGVGSNAKMNEFQAAMGICNIKYIDNEIAKRKRIYDRYLNNLGHKKGLQFMKMRKGLSSNYGYFPVVFHEDILGYDREKVYASLQKENIYARRYFYPLISDYQCYRNKFNSDRTPIAQYISDRILTLPLYADISIDDVDRICRIVLDP